ncbi:uncharacterized protein BDZ99DRAFT_508043 [Mytilinidion resinicola]|uniref:Uncharacterized protein n=1 Tax=Mytilinidion resinicola TaxID=574789 RepID=A0A6A6YSF4_9PEZI|nr:uncharacterized protein BDZ99DRAFT_508043 [Mytilinidion resinicola]KAF2811730.1 hypothetical protein BDZ99DRAFT_508043 [Mytilinidion resinicola]
MQAREELIPFDEFQIGLDRSAIDHKGQIQLPEQHLPRSGSKAPRQDADKHTEPATNQSSSHHILTSIKEHKHDAAKKLRKAFHISESSDNLSSESLVLADTSNEKSDSRLVNRLPMPEKHTLKDFVANPVDTVKSKVSGQGSHQLAANIASKEISHGKEVDLVNAHSAVERAKTDEEKLLAIQDLSMLMKERQSTFVRWTLDRHITKVRVLPRDTFARKSRAAFETKNIEGDIVMNWRAYGQHASIIINGQYIGSGSDPPTPSKETILPNIERLIVASSPFQELIMTTRRVYRWENSTETTKYLLIYLTLWYLNLILPGVLAAIVYFVVDRRVHRNTLEDLREDIKHREDVHRTALSLTEFIEKRGDEKWANDLLEGSGRWLMIQLADLAGFFESLRNFYEWLVPSRTIATLKILAVATLFTAVAPVWLLAKITTFGAGVIFFGLFPLATNFPEYRLLVSPSKRIFWNIPTHAEWTIKYIQAEGTHYVEHATQLPSAPPIKVSSGSENLRDYGFYTAHHDDDTGRLIISTSSVRFVSNVAHKVHWHLTYDQISNLEKLDRVVAKNVPKLKNDSGKDLRLISKAGEEWVLINVDRRDEAFSQIVGFSATTWQVVW